MTDERKPVGVVIGAITGIPMVWLLRHRMAA